MKVRLDKLKALEMKFNGDSYVGKKDWNIDFNVHTTEIALDSDMVWAVKIAKLEKEFTLRQTVKHCDFCGEEFKGRNFPTYDENFNVDNNFRCSDCFGEELMDD